MKNVLIIVLLLSVVIACNKDPEIPYCELHPDDCVDVREVKDYFYFKLGTWWVFEEENTGLRDSVYVTETYSDTGSVIFETWLHSSYDGYDYTYWTTGVDPSVKNNIAKKSERSTSVTRAKSKPGDYIAEAKCFLFYPSRDLWTYSYGGAYIDYDNILRIEEILSSLNNLDKTFHNVIVVSEEHTAIEDSQPTRHFYSPNIGLIKKELLDSNQIWSLVDYHIEN